MGSPNAISAVNREASGLSLCATRAAFAQSSATIARLSPCLERENRSFAGGNAVFPIGTLVAYAWSG
jgi:hypothetical protein